MHRRWRAPGKKQKLFCAAYCMYNVRVVIEYAPLEDELGDVLEKAMRHSGLTEQALAERSAVTAEKIRDAVDYRYDLTASEIRRLATTLELNEIGLTAIAQGRYPLPEIAGLPFCLYPLRFPHGIGVANAYIVAANGRGGEIRTRDLYVPNVALYQAKLRPDDAGDKVTLQLALY
jgi:hypothetical protein